MPVPAPDRPAREMQREPAFNEILFEIRDIIEKLESLPESAKSDGVP
jgi:hypothetical protein